MIKGKNGEPVTRKWTLFKDPIYGFPNESTFATLYEIIQIWNEQGFQSPEINFGSFANLISRKGHKGRPGRREYDRIKKDLSCLRGVRIKAENAFWDSTRNQYVDKDFGLFNEVTTYKDSPNSRKRSETIIEASKTFFNSIRNNNLFVTGLASEYFHALPPLAQRLAVYLSKIFKFQSVHKRNVLEFAQQLPIHAKLYKHKKLTLVRACKTVKESPLGILEDFDFEPISMRPKNEFIVLFSGKPKKRLNGSGKPHSKYPKREEELDLLVKDILAVCNDPHSTGFYRKVAYYMPKDDIYRAISEVKEILTHSSDVKAGALFTSRIKSFADQRGITVFSR